MKKYDVFDLDINIAKFIVPRLKQFRKVVKSYPNLPNNVLNLDGYNFYLLIIDKIIWSFEQYLDDKNNPYFKYHNVINILITNKEIKEMENEYQMKKQHGLDLFAKYFGTLWL